MRAKTDQSSPENKQQNEMQRESRNIIQESHAAENYVTGSTTSVTCGVIMASPSPSPPPVSKKEIELAVLDYIRAIRVLRRTQINTQEIANALGIRVQEVNIAIEELKVHGVMPLR
jgi:hypothetical protein